MKKECLENIIQERTLDSTLRPKLVLREELKHVDFAIELVEKGDPIAKIYLWKMYNDHYVWLPGKIEIAGEHCTYFAEEDGGVLGTALGNWSTRFPGYLQIGLKIADHLGVKEDLIKRIKQMRNGESFLKNFKTET